MIWFIQMINNTGSLNEVLGRKGFKRKDNRYVLKVCFASGLIILLIASMVTLALSLYARRTELEGCIKKIA